MTASLSLGLESQLRKLRQGIGRLIDSYAEGLIEKSEFEPRIARLKERVGALDARATDLAAHAAQESDLRLIIGHLQDFARTFCDGLDQLDWAAQRGIIRTLVKRVEIDQGQVNVVFRVGPGPLSSTPDPASLPHCGRSGHASLRSARVSGVQDSFVHIAGLEPLPDQFPGGERPDGGEDMVM